MAKSPERPAHISAGDWDAVDVPEATAEQWRGARPFGDVFPELAKKRGRPVAQAPKKAISFRFSADIVEAIKASKGYNGSIEKFASRSAFDQTRRRA